jgi:hypothetical protein
VSVAAEAKPARSHARPLQKLAAFFEGEMSVRRVFACLVGLVVLSSLWRIGLVRQVHGASIFMDELGYEKLAQSIGVHGRLALFDNPGLSYSPLYPALLSPIFAFGASAPSAYTLIKSVNSVLLSLSVFPVYAIARYALSRRLSLLVAALMLAAPLMGYSAYVMSESLAFPLCLVAVWAILAAIRSPSAGRDALALGAILLATSARLQLIVLVPVALTAILLAAVLDRDASEGRLRSLWLGIVRHKLLFGVIAGITGLAAVAALAGQGVLAVGGRYAVVGRRSFPDLGHLLRVLVEHVAGLEFAVGVLPFVAALVVAYSFFRSPSRDDVPFAAVAVSLTVWLLLETGYDAARFDSPTGDLPRIHERFLIYVVPLFFVSLVVLAGRVQRRIGVRVYLVAAAAAAILPLAIRFHTVINNTASVDTFGLQPFATPSGGELVAVPYAALAAVAAAAAFAVLFVVVRHRLRSVVMLMLIGFVVVGTLSRIRTNAFSEVSASLVPAQQNWVDRAVPAGSRVSLVAVGADAALVTAFSNNSIAHVYAFCGRTFSSEFGERYVTIDKLGRIRDGTETVRASYVVVPASVYVQGRVVAWNPDGDQELVAPANGTLVVPRWNRHVTCPRAT